MGIKDPGFKSHAIPQILSPHDYHFPDPNLALTEPNGLLALGGDLTSERLMAAYQHGIFPWYNRHDPILWWSPNPRAVLFLNQLKMSRSLAKTIRKNHFKITINQAFSQVITACATVPRGYTNDTWINPAMIQAYTQLHTMGIAHSIEVWQQAQLVGGLYGLAIGSVFCGESMFSTQTDASKVALVTLVELLKTQPCQLIDCQIPNPHLTSLGATTIPRTEYLYILKQGLEQKICLQFPKSFKAY